ncbi:MAG TPA: hypothetical protein VEX18_10075, partial [Polyangiaceae bacterium]|nr:hypothetical protein [Polyangiaceae bacterium]
MWIRAARYPLCVSLWLGPAAALAQATPAKPGSLPEAPPAAPKVPAPPPANKAQPVEKPAPAPRTAEPPAAKKPATDVGRGAGSRSVLPSPAPVAPPPATPEPGKPPSTGSHQKGRPPAKPSP